MPQPSSPRTNAWKPASPPQQKALFREAADLQGVTLTDFIVSHHPHLHCVVPGGGLSPDGTRWIACRSGFFLPVRVLSRLFRRLFLTALHDAREDGQLRFTASLQALSEPQGFADHLQPSRKTEWVVYAKPPFAGPQQVLDYVGRYTHRVAISNQRLLDIDDGHVRFRYKDYRADRSQTPQTMTLAATEFIRRVLVHVLPTGFHRMRHYGLLGNRHRKEQLARCRHLLGTSAPETPAPPRSTDYATDTTPSRGSPCGPARSVRTGTCSSLSTWRAPRTMKLGDVCVGVGSDAFRGGKFGNPELRVRLRRPSR